MAKNTKKFVFLIMIFLAGIIVESGAATISLSPIAGGSTLQFSRSEVLSGTSRELRIRITSTESDQYQVFQRWVQPLTSSSGGGLQRDFLKYYGLSGSNGFGTLYGQVPEFISMGDRLVYTSAPNGSSDSFVLVYQVDRERLSSAGQFSGRLLISLRPIGSGQAQEAYLDVFVDADLNFKFELSSLDGGNVIRLDDAILSDDTMIASFEGNAGELRVYQEVLSPISLLGDKRNLVKGQVSYLTKGSSGDGIKVFEPKILEFGRDLIYRSYKDADSFDIVYAFDPDNTFPLSAGTYRGQIRYIVETSQGQQFFDADIEVIIDPVFEIILEFPDGKIDFANLYPGASPQERRVLVKVNSNLEKPYAVSQHLVGALQNDQRGTIDPEHFLIKTVLDDETPGKGKFLKFAPVDDSGNQFLYRSDEAGTPVEFEVYYRVVPYSDMSAGDYRTEITYTLGEI